MSDPRILHLTLKKQWFDMIASGVKREEYRERKPYWNKRLSKHYDIVQFRNGYRKDSPTMRFEIKEVLTSLGIVEWGAPVAEIVYIIRLGNRTGARPGGEVTWND
jgi:hypothetical protein